jgi:hypothetical protein
VFAGLQTFLELKTRKLTVAFRCTCDLYLTFNEFRKVFRKIPEQLDAALLRTVSHSSSVGFCELAYSSLFNDAVGWESHSSETLRNVDWQLVTDVSGQTVEPIFKSQAAQDIIYIYIFKFRMEETS